MNGAITHLSWWTTRGEQATERRNVAQAVLNKVADVWGRAVYPGALARSRQPLWLVTTRSGPGQKPGYLLITDPIASSADAFLLSLLRDTLNPELWPCWIPGATEMESGAGKPRPHFIAYVLLYPDFGLPFAQLTCLY